MKNKKLLRFSSIFLAVSIALSPTVEVYAVKDTKVTNLEDIKETYEKQDEIINKILNMTKTDETCKERAKRVQEAIQEKIDKGEINSSLYPTLIDDIAKYYIISNTDGTYVTSMAELETRKQSAQIANATNSVNTEGLTLVTDPDTAVDPDTLIDGTESAESGYFPTDDVKVTTKEEAFRSGTNKQKEFKSQFEYVKNKVSQYASSYKNYESNVTDTFTNTVISGHKIVLGTAKAGNTLGVGGSNIPNNVYEYDVLADMLKLDLSGLETLTLMNTMVNYGDDSQKSYIVEQVDDIIAEYKGYFGTEDDSIQNFSSGLTSPKFFYHDSNAVVDTSKLVDENDKDIAEAFNSAGFSIAEMFYRKFIPRAITPDNIADVNATTGSFKGTLPTVPDTQSSDKALYEATAKRNSDGYDILTSSDMYNNPLDFTTSDGSTPVSASMSKYAYTFTSQLAFWSRYISEGKDSEAYKNFLAEPMITNNLTVSTPEGSDAVVPDNAFLQIELTMYGSLDFARIIEVYNVENGEEDDIDNFIKALGTIRNGYVEVSKTALALANFYDLMGYATRATELRDHVETQIEAYNSIIADLQGEGKTVPTAIDNSDINIGDNILPEKKEEATENTNEAEEQSSIDELANSENYYELIAWTAAFTPFETNVNDFVRNATFLTPTAQKYYRDELGKVTPVYAVEGDKGLIKTLQEGNTRQLDYISLRDFIVRHENDDLVLFANRYSSDQIYQAKVNGIILSQTENEDGTTTETITSTNIVNTSNRTDNNSKFIGPVYISTPDTEYATNSSAYESLARREVEANTAAQNLESEAKNANSNTTPTEEEMNSALTGVQTIGSNEIAAFLDNFTPSSFYINYALMHNVLKDGAQNTSAIEADMDRPLYIDFIGNIITESGYVVVPAAANTTYYRDVESSYPLYTAMFLNSYPDTSFDSSSNLALKGNDKGKFVLSILFDDEKTTEQESGKKNVLENGSLASNKKFKVCLIKTSEKDGEASEIDKKLYLHTIPCYKYCTRFTDTQNLLSKVPSEEDDDIISFIDLAESFVDMGPAYIKGMSSKKALAKVFSLTNFYNSIAIDVDGVGTTVALNGVSSIPTDASWKAIITIIRDHYLNHKNQTSEKVESLLYVKQRFIALARIVDKCSTNPEEMLIDSNFVKYEDLLKDNPIVKALGDLTEKVINNLYGMFSTNLLLYTPTFANIGIFKRAHLYVKPLTLAALILVLSIVIFGILLQKLGGSQTSLYSLAMTCLLIVVVFVYNLNFHPMVVKWLYSDLPGLMLNNRLVNYVGYDLESKYKTDKNQFFADIPSTEKDTTGKMLLKLKDFSDDEVVELRKSGSGDSRVEVNSMFYSPRYDNNRMNIVSTDIFLKGDSLYITVDDLLDKSSIEDIVNKDGTISMEQKIYNEVDNISYFTPYYNILESLTYTVNTFSEGCDAQVKLKNYKNTIKTTGRGLSYFNSIFFISPDHVDQIRESTKQQFIKNANDNINSNLFADETMTDEELEEEITKYNNRLEELDSNIDIAYAFLLEGMGDLEDWLGLKKVLYLSDSNTMPFVEEKRLTTIMTDWYPESLRDIALGNSKQSDSQISAYNTELEYKVESINRAVKSFVINDLAPVADCFSDDTLLKLVALRATMEFNTQFSQIGGRQYYPKTIEAEGLDNKYTLMSSYISQRELFSSSSDGLSYILAYHHSWPALVLAFIDSLLRLVSYAIPIIAICSTIILPFLLLICYGLRNKRGIQFVYTCIALAVMLSLFRFVNVITYMIVTTASNSFGIMGSLCLNIGLSCLSIILARITATATVNCIKRGIISAGYGIINKLEHLATGRGSSRYDFSNYDNYDRDYARSSWDIDTYGQYDNVNPRTGSYMNDSTYRRYSGRHNRTSAYDFYHRN